jgi:hypothetical protein
MSMNHVEAFGLPIKVPGIARLVFLFQKKVERDRPDWLSAGLPGECNRLGNRRSKQLDLVTPLPKIPAEIIDDPLCSAVGFRWDRNIDARDLGDLHRIRGSTLSRHSPAYAPRFDRRES